MNLDEIMEKPYWIIDILPKQVPGNSPGQYFKIEKLLPHGHAGLWQFLEKANKTLFLKRTVSNIGMPV